jgi:hypothetical protein
MSRLSPTLVFDGRTGRPRDEGDDMRRPTSSIERVTDERGVTTAEYAVATAAGAGFAGLLYKMLSGGFGNNLIRTLFDHVLGLLGLG